MLISISDLLNSTCTRLDRAYSFDKNQAPFGLDRAVSGKRREVVTGAPVLGAELWSQAVQVSPRTNCGMLRGLVHFSSVAQLCPTLCDPCTAACQTSLSFTISQSFLKLISIKLVMPSNHLTLCRPFSSHLWSFPAAGFLLMSRLFASGGQSIGVSASVLPMSIQDWFPLRLTGLISLKSKWLSGVFSKTTVQKHQFFSTQLSSWSNSHIHIWLLEKP